MAYVAALHPDDGFDVTFFKDECGFHARIGVGFDDETDHVFSAHVALVSYPGAGPDEVELMFSLLKSTPDGQTVTEYRDGLASKQDIPDEGDRKQILLALVSCAICTVQQRVPNLVVINTIKTNLPQRALDKYFYIAVNVGQVLGYEGGKVDEYHGQHQWILKKT